VRKCLNVTLIANNSLQNYCTKSKHYSVSYSTNSGESDVCFVDIRRKSDELLSLNITRLATGSGAPTIGHLCRRHSRIEVLVDTEFYNLCGQWTQTALPSIPTFTAYNKSSIIIRIYAISNKQQVVSDDDSPAPSLPPTHDTAYPASDHGFCIAYQTRPKPHHSCQSADGWFHTIDYCYKVFDDRMTWFDAQAVCKRQHLNANLVAVTAPKIQKLLDEYLVERQTHRNYNNR